MDFYIGPKIRQFARLADFIADVDLTERDVVLTNKAIIEPHLGRIGDARLIYQEQFGEGEPTDEVYDQLRAITPPNAERIFAIGGGSVMDCAKLMCYGGDFKTQDLFDGDIVPEKIRQLYALPSTCGTGSEVTNLISVGLRELKVKKGIGFPSMYPDVAVLVPELLKTLPYKVFATSSMDALIHATESYLSPQATSLTEMFSVDAIRRIVKGYRQIAKRGEKAIMENVDDFLLASTNAGIAFGNAGCAAVHALSYPLGGAYHIPHGEANQIMFMAVMKAYKRIQPVGKINLFEALLADCFEVKQEDALTALDELTTAILPVQPLNEYGVEKEHIQAMAEGVMAG
ncbi:MAG TPA: 4-hydroxybutyrate dehydrogenase, partial [Clostridiaceae bacterium]|nr:4-hydroxybutyrate dehydrogenase [Clostridiaceae bacterium]